MNTKKKIALITGASSGIGRVTAIELARVGFYVVLAGRSEKKYQGVIDEINFLVGSNSCEWLCLDLQSLQSVKNCANIFLKTNRSLSLLINNAGIAGLSGITSDGFELGFGVNHLGHFLLTNLLLDSLKKPSNARIVTVSSNAHKHVKFIDWDLLIKKTSSITGVNEYATSKLANILFSRELSKKLCGTNVSTYCLHPGVVDTNIWHNLPVFLKPILKLRGMLTPQEGARTTLYCSLDAPHNETGQYYSSGEISSPTYVAESDALAMELWDRSYQWTRKFM